LYFQQSNYYHVTNKNLAQIPSTQKIFNSSKQSGETPPPPLYLKLFLTKWVWSYGSWIYNYLCNQCTDVVSSILDQGGCTTLCDKLCQWFSLGPPVSSTNKTERHDITEILLKVALSTIKQCKLPSKVRESPPPTPVSLKC
jgi:hypothetical protein